MIARVIDTNVLAVANQKSPQANLKCVIAAVELLELARQQIVVIDQGMEIFKEYNKHCSLSGQPGLGDVFFKHLHQNQANPERCEIVTITKLPHDNTNYNEFPSDPNLAAFDPSDRKFVAVALTSTNQPTIFNAVDSDWLAYETALLANGVQVITLCPDCCKRMYH